MTYTEEQVREALRALDAKKGKEKTTDVLLKLGAHRLPDVDATMYGYLMDRIEEALSGEDEKLRDAEKKGPFAVYLAGRIEQSNTRFGLVNSSYTDGEAIGSTVPDRFHLYGEHVFRYTGPFTLEGGYTMKHYQRWLGYPHGRKQGGFGTGSHGDESPSTEMADVHARALEGIRQAHAVFAWVEDKKCFGTLHELGFARALGKPIFIAHPPKVKRDGELWFTFASATAIAEVGTPEAGVNRFFRWATYDAGIAKRAVNHCRWKKVLLPWGAALASPEKGPASDD